MCYKSGKNQKMVVPKKEIGTTAFYLQSDYIKGRFSLPKSFSAPPLPFAERDRTLRGASQNFRFPVSHGHIWE
jgi:hypothetical protein